MAPDEQKKVCVALPSRRLRAQQLTEKPRVVRRELQEVLLVRPAHDLRPRGVDQRQRFLRVHLLHVRRQLLDDRLGDGVERLR